MLEAVSQSRGIDSVEKGRLSYRRWDILTLTFASEGALKEVFIEPDGEIYAINIAS